MTGGTEPAGRRRRRRVLGPLGVVVAAAVGVAAARAWGRAGLPDPAAAEGDPVLDVWRLLLATALALGSVVLFLLAVALVEGVRNQRLASARETAPAGGDAPLLSEAGVADEPASPRPASSDTRLELTYTIIPLVIAAAVFALGLRTTARQELDRPASLTVEVTGFQWGWRYAYDGGPVVLGTAEDPPELVLPLRRDVRLELVANDVQHSFFVPAFLIKRDLIPGRTNALVLRAEREGPFLGHCAEFCGLDHARMNFTVRVVPAEEFDRWLATGAPTGGA